MFRHIKELLTLESDTSFPVSSFHLEQYPTYYVYFRITGTVHVGADLEEVRHAIAELIDCGRAGHVQLGTCIEHC